MHKTSYSLPIAALLFLLFSQVSGQGTFTQVHQLLQANCSGSGCHDGSGATFNVTLSDSAFYAAIVGVAPLYVTPVNPAAAARGDKLIKPGYVEKSFLLRKIAHGLNVPLSLKYPQEGNDMPSGLPALKDYEIELVRQWILFGARDTGMVVDTAMINKYYREGGVTDTYPLQPAPDSGTGFQMYVGKIFVPPHSEDYYYIKHKPEISGNTEVPRIVGFMPQSTHHMVIYKFLQGGEVNYREGIRPEEETSHADVLDGIGMGKGLWDYSLPPNTAYFWPSYTTLDFNLHIKNPSDSVMGTDLYFNVYTQPVNTAQHSMKIRNFPVFTISIPQDGQEHTDTEVANDTNETHYWKVWQLYTHTHKYGTDYDVFLRNEDGSMGNQEYEGCYSYEQDFMVGYYRTGVDVTFKYYPDDSLLVVDPRLGFIHRAKWRNTGGPDPIVWGLTSDWEMMVMGFQYIEGDLLGPLAVPELNNETIQLNVFPNPASGKFSLNYVLEHAADIKVDLTDVLGETIRIIEQKNKPAGNYMEDVELDKGIAPGIYMLSFHIGAAVTTRRVVIE